MNHTDSVLLKVKAKSLAAEARIIRRDEKKYRGTFRHEQLYRHRLDVVRKVARETHLALNFIYGREIDECERTYDKHVWLNWDAVKKMVDRYGVQRYLYENVEDYNLAKAHQDVEFKLFSERKSRKIALVV